MSSLSRRKRSSDTPVAIKASDTNNISNNTELEDGDTTISTLKMAATATNTATTNTTTTKLRVRIKKFHGVAKWTWNVGNGGDDEVCGICQSAFEGCPPGVKFPGDESPVVFGTCGTYVCMRQY